MGVPLERLGEACGFPRDIAVFFGSMVTVLVLMSPGMLRLYWAAGSLFEWSLLFFFTIGFFAGGLSIEFVLTKVVRSWKKFMPAAFAFCLLTCSVYLMVYSLVDLHPSTLLFLRLGLCTWAMGWLNSGAATIAGLPSPRGWRPLRAIAWPLNRKTVRGAADLLGGVAFLIAIPVPWEVVLPSGHLVFLGGFGFGWLCVLLIGSGHLFWPVLVGSVALVVAAHVIAVFLLGVTTNHLLLIDGAIAGLALYVVVSWLRKAWIEDREAVKTAAKKNLLQEAP